MQIPPQQTMCLKVFDLDKIEPEGSSATSPECIGILRIFTNQFPEAKVLLRFHFIQTVSCFMRLLYRLDILNHDCSFFVSLEAIS